MRVHYPRTAHLPWSPGATPDDIRVGDLRGLIGREVVVTEKLDGENTTIYREGLHARSLDSGHHPSRAWVKALHGRVGSQIPDGWRVCGENMYACHSISYVDLVSWFYGFSVWDAADRCLDWDDTVSFLNGLGIPTPPVLWRGTFDEKAIRSLRLDMRKQEGYVVRTAAGFNRAEFTARVAKWVRPNHVLMNMHWMHAEIVPNSLGRESALWALRSGAHVASSDLLSALSLDPSIAGGRELIMEEALSRLDATHRLGDVRLITAIAAALHAENRTSIATRLAAGPLGMPLARRVADLVGLHTRLHTPFPDEQRRNGLARMSLAVDLAALHALAEAVLAARPEDTSTHEEVRSSAAIAGRPEENSARKPVRSSGVIAGGPEDTSAREPVQSSAVIAGGPEDKSAREPVQSSAVIAGGPEDKSTREQVQSSARIGGRAEDASAREQVQWSALYAEDSGLMVPEPWRPLRDGLRRELELADLPRLAADRCWAQARTAWADGRLASVEEAIAATWPWRGGEFPQLIQMVGPSGSGKSRLTAGLKDVAVVVSMDDLREKNASRADQRSNPEILTAALARLGSALRTAPPGTRVIWDATGLNRPQRSLVLRAAQAADAYVTQAVFLVDESALRARNAARPHPVPVNVLTSQITRYQPPYPAEAHRTWYVGGDGTVADSDGEL